MTTAYTSSPLFSISANERAMMEQRLRDNPLYDPEIREVTEAFGGRFLLGARNTLTGSAGWGLGSLASSLLNEDTSDPLNISVSRASFDPLRDPMSYSMGNSPEAIAEDLKDIPFEYWPELVTAKTFGQYRDHLTFIKAGLPVGQAEASTAGVLFGQIADIAALTAVGMAAEPLALAGLGARTTLAGRAVKVAGGSSRSLGIAEAAAEAATVVSRTGLVGRYTALGIAEEVAYQAVRNGIDPTYDPDASEVIWGLALSGGIAGVLGGAVFGKAFVRENIEEAATDLIRRRVTELPGGYTISYSNRMVFDSEAAVDAMLLRQGDSFEVETNRIGQDMWDNWQRDPTIPDPNFAGTRADLTIPGTRTVRIGEVPVAPAPREVGAPPLAPPTQPPTIRPRSGQLERMGIRSALNAAAFELSQAGVPLSAAVFGGLARALVRTERAALKAGAFNKRFWEEVAKEIPNVNLRPISQRTFIPGIDRTVVDVVAREDMVDAVWSMYRRNAVNGVDTRNSLVFRVLSEIRTRGGIVNRKVVAEVIDSLREVAQNPPKKTDKGGRKILDRNARRLAVNKIVNKYAASDQQVYIPDSLLNKMSGGGGGITGGGVGLPPIGGGKAGADPNFDSVPQVKAWFERLPWISPLLNQSARLMESDNGAARLLGHLAFHAKRSFEIAQPQTIFEAGSMVLHGLSFTFMRGYRNGLVRYAMRDSTKTPNILNTLRLLKNRKLHREFDEKVVKQLRTGAFDDASDAVNETARGLRDLLNKIENMAFEVGLKGFQKSSVRNYMPRLWRWDRIRRLGTTAEGKQALIDLIKKSIDQNGRRIVIDGVEQTITGDIDDAARVFADRLMAIANKTENAPLLEQEQELADALLRLQAPIKGKGPSGGTPFGRARTLLDETAEISLGQDFLGSGRNALSIADLTNNELPFVMRKYITSIMGSINQRRMINAFNDELRARGVFGPEYKNKSGEMVKGLVEAETVEDMIQLARKIGGSETISAGQEEAFYELMAAIRYDPIHKGPMSVPARLLGLLMNYGYLVTGGQFGLAQMGEISRLVGTLGLGKVITQMPILKEMVTNWKNLDRDSQNLASLVDVWFSPSTDRLRRAFTTEMTETQEFTGFLGAVERGMGIAANTFSDISLLAPITSFTQQLTAATTLQHLYDVFKHGSKRLDNATVRALGLEPEQYEQIIQFIGKNAETRAGFMGERIVGLKNIDAKDMDLVKAFVQRMIESRIQSVATRGDFHKSVFSVLGRLVTQFRTFNLKGIDNFLIQNATRVGRGGGLKVAQEITATLMFAGTIQYLRTYADWRSQTAAREWKDAKETEKRLGIKGFIRGAFTGPAEFFVPSLLTDGVASFTTGSPVFSPYRYSGLDWFGFPGEAQIKRFSGLMTDVYGRAVGKPLGLETEREITQGTIRKARLLLPGQNLPGLKQYLNIGESEIADAWNLRERQPRRPKPD